MQQKLKHIATGVITLVIAITLSSCGSAEEKLIKKQIDAMNEYADEFAKDPQSDKLAKIDKRIEEIGEKMKDMDPSDEVKKELEDKYKAELETAAQRYIKAKMSAVGGGLKKLFKGIPMQK